MERDADNVAWFALYYPRLRIAYNAIPKNACSSVKATLAHANDGGCFQKTPHELDGRYRAAPRVIDDTWLRLVVLRDPFERLVSAYLDKMLKPLEPQFKKIVVQARYEMGEPPPVGDESLSLRQFFYWFRSRPIEATDAHWRPQTALLTFDRFDLAINCGRLADGWRESGLEAIAPLRPFQAHGTSAKSNWLDANLVDMPGHHIYGYITTTGEFPPQRCFRNPTLIAEVREYYRRDYDLIGALFGDSHEAFAGKSLPAITQRMISQTPVNLALRRARATKTPLRIAPVSSPPPAQPNTEPSSLVPWNASKAPLAS